MRLEICFDPLAILTDRANIRKRFQRFYQLWWLISVELIWAIHCIVKVVYMASK